MMTTKHGRWMTAAALAVAAAAIVASCGGTGGGSGRKGNPGDQFVLNSSNAGRLVLNVNPSEVDANKSDRIGLVATLTDSRGTPIRGIAITFSSDIPDISFIPGQTDNRGQQIGVATTDVNGNADIIAVAGVTPTGTGDIIGTGAIFAAPPSGFGLLAQAQVTLLDVGFIDADAFSVIPSGIDLVEPAPGTVVFFNIVGGTPPYELKNEVSDIGTATISQHCAPGCTENGGVLCVGSPCQSDVNCGVGSPHGTCVGPIKRCLASCRGTNCGGSRCATDADCNDGSPTPANVCKDSGQSIAYIISSADVAGTRGFTVEDSAGDSVQVTVTVSFVCGNGVARGDEQCDLGDLREQTCASLGFTGGGTLLCNDECEFDTSNCVAAATPTAPAPTLTVTPTGSPTVTSSPTPTLSPTPVGTPGPAANLTLALLNFKGGDNNNGTATTVVSATVTDSNGNPVADGTEVLFGILSPTDGAAVSSPSQTKMGPSCDVSNFEAATQTMVLNQPGVAHACITYPITTCSESCPCDVFDQGNPSDCEINCPDCTVRITGAVSGTLAADEKPFNLPVAVTPPPPTPTVTPTP